MSTQLDQWQGDFGRDYTTRNVVDHSTRTDTFGRILSEVKFSDLLEVGTNRGHNLLALQEWFGDGWTFRGIEPAEFARKIALQQGLAVIDGSIYEIPYGDGEFDVVFTSGVLIHVPPGRLDEALAEMLRVARRYVLAIEYHADEDEEVEYRGAPEMLWRRDYGTHYLRVCPSLSLVSMGDLTEADGFGGARWWLMEKAA